MCQAQASTTALASQTPEIVITDVLTEDSVHLSTTSVKALGERLAQEFEAPDDLVLYILEKESRFGLDTIGDMDITCGNRQSSNYGKPVRARGPLQITDCYHPEITDDQAFDAEWSLRWALPLILNKKTCLHEWTTCRMFYRR